MITASQVNLSSTGSRSGGVLDLRNSQLRVTSGREPDDRQQALGQARELVLSRDAQLRFQGREQLAVARASRIEDASGNQTLLASADVAQRASALSLNDSEALRVGRAALGSGESINTGGSARLEANRYTFVSESESRQFVATGRIELESGETVDFSLALSQSQSRQYEFSESVRIEERPMTDPIVINFDAPTARLRDTFFEFDLDADGDNEQLATLGKGSGYLVLDRNGNGEVDDGSELFGPATGSGFNELASLDSDGNRFVDSGDPVFGKLGVMVQTADGESQLRSLDEVGVRALFTGNTSGSFTLTSSQGVPLGEIKATGLFVNDEGQVRTMEELDLARQEEMGIPSETRIATLGGASETSAQAATGEALSNERDNGRIESIQQALDKLNRIGARQEAFIERSQGKGASDETALDRFMDFTDRMRLELMERQELRQRAVREFDEIRRAGE